LISALSGRGSAAHCGAPHTHTPVTHTRVQGRLPLARRSPSLHAAHTHSRVDHSDSTRGREAGVGQATLPRAETAKRLDSLEMPVRPWRRSEGDLWPCLCVSCSSERCVAGNTSRAGVGMSSTGRHPDLPPCVYAGSPLQAVARRLCAVHRRQCYCDSPLRRRAVQRGRAREASLRVVVVVQVQGEGRGERRVCAAGVSTREDYVSQRVLRRVRIRAAGGVDAGACGVPTRPSVSPSCSLLPCCGVLCCFAVSHWGFGVVM
jgi:hypothetical protein